MHVCQVSPLRMYVFTMDSGKEIIVSLLIEDDVYLSNIDVYWGRRKRAHPCLQRDALFVLMEKENIGLLKIVRLHQ